VTVAQEEEHTKNDWWRVKSTGLASDRMVADAPDSARHRDAISSTVGKRVSK